MSGLGYIYAPDVRDFRMRSLAASPLTHRYWLNGPILDQGQTNACVGYSMKQLIQSEPYLTREGPSGWDIYQRALKLDEFPGEQDSGTSLRAGLKALSDLVERYEWAYNSEQVKQWILQYGPVIAGTQLTTGMHTTDQNYYMNLSGTPLGGHAYMLSGYSSMRNAFRVTNSWGSMWAFRGRAWIRYSDLDYLLAHQGEAVGIIERSVAV